MYFKNPEPRTGLGLSVVYGIVERHEGFLHGYSEPGSGRTFKVYVPVIELARPLSDRPEQEVPLRRGTENILLVDDEKQIRDLGRELLTRFGYTVHSCSDGEAALELYRRRREDIDPVILDLIMPCMGGSGALRNFCR